MIEITNTTKTRIDQKKITAICEIFLKKYKQSKKDISIAIVGEARMRTLNNIYRSYDKTTDILSFSGVGGDTLLGELIINPKEIKKISKYKEILEFCGFDYHWSKRIENYLFYFILVHGLLHLVGYDDAKEKDRQRMLELGRDFLKKNDIM